MAGAIRLFEQATHAQLYAKFRPSYPKSVLEAISKFVSKHGGAFELAVDVACGSGQSTFHLCKQFTKCLGVDISSPQIEEGKRKAHELGVTNIDFKVGSASAIPVQDSSVDLLSCAQAWHWMEPKGLYREASRVLKPNGCLAIYGYGNAQLANEACRELVSHFYSHTLKGYWHSRRSHIDELYRDCRLPYKITERLDMPSPSTMTLANFIGYVSSWSGYITYLEKNPESDALSKLERDIQAIMKTSEGEDQTILKLSFPFFLILGKKD